MRRTGKVLVTGVLLADEENHAIPISSELAASRDWTVDQRWAAIGNDQSARSSLRLAWWSPQGEPKFSVINQLLAGVNLEEYDFLIVVDDDIDLPGSFLDKYLELLERFDFALAQPARTHDSYVDHAFVEQLDGITARQTLFVEIGPLFSIRRDAILLLTPFDMTSPMGWGYDFAWPTVITSAGLKMGIIDGLPVRHALRK